ncbi:hypothetical protein [Actinoplanes couchii]|uniref:Uncharacterized protein n=1 Tax=Actinoplanes couchii TaxID=403638 RepID=A0ABQ3WZU1_9ACTN|nr:hypothetical protein [Actinoplanes couchii]MDR6316187.1 hypothetical protein [Actinoplanes couchii]GID51802.1 hypothetical protein Aco03nite_002060 [Actinoplanes couchii]
MNWGDGVTDSDDQTSSLTRARTNSGPASRPRIPRQRDGAAEERARLRHLATQGLLGTLGAEERRRLLPAAFEVAYPIVYDVITRRVARNRGHNQCGHGLHQMEDTCLDGFQDDLEAVIDHLMSATAPISDLEGWLARRAQNAAIDGHRRRRGEQGAQQRPRMTRALAEALDDPWLEELALKILTWVGLPAGVGATEWPVGSWARDRADFTGDHRGSTPDRARADVDRVLAVMRRRPGWYEKNIDQPLGRKTAPVGGSPGEQPGEPRPLLAAGPAEILEARIGDLAGLAVLALQERLRRGDDPTFTVVEVLTTLFLGGTGADEIDHGPIGAPASDERVSALLTDPAALSVLVQHVLGIVRAG